MTPDEARDALGSVGETNARMADRMHWPWWRHALAGLYLAALVGSLVLDNAARIILVALAVVGVLLIIRDDKQRHGMFVSGYQRGRTGWVLLANGVVVGVAVLAMNSWVKGGMGDPLFWLVTGGVLLASTLLSYIWEVVYRADLRRRADV